MNDSTKFGWPEVLVGALILIGPIFIIAWRRLSLKACALMGIVFVLLLTYIGNSRERPTTGSNAYQVGYQIGQYIGTALVGCFVGVIWYLVARLFMRRPKHSTPPSP